MFMRYNGATSTRKLLPGSSPQGAFLGILLFIIIFNGALLRPSVPRPNSLTLKYIDDLSVLVAINLKSSLINDPVDRVKPLNFNERTQHILPSSENYLQDQLDNLQVFTTEKLLKIKEKKTNLMKINFSRDYDFPPELAICGFNTDYICKKGFKKIWMLRRMTFLDVEPLFILDVYLKEIRSIWELAVPAWHSGLTVKQAEDIERVQKVALKIILGEQKERKASYDMAMVILDIEPLHYRREKLCLSFAKKTLKSRHSEIFKPTTQNTRNRPMFYEHNSNKTRCYNSPLNYLTRLLNLN